MSTLVVLEVDGGAVTEPSLQAIAAASGLGAEVTALIVDRDPAAEPDLGRYGVVREIVTELAEPVPYAPARWGRMVADAVISAEAHTVLGAATDRVGEVLATAAALLDAPLATACVAIDGGSPLRVTRQRWGGSVLEDAEIGGPVRLLTVVPHTWPAAEASQTADCLWVRLPFPAADGREATLLRHEPPREDQVELGDAKLVVGGGRGVGGADGFVALEQLATRLGGVMGASRVATNSGWVPHDRQIGQTGARIAPELYIACGVSGAVQHVVACKGARKLLAINKDRDAPIMALADYAVVGDVATVVPALVEALGAQTGDPA